MGETSPGRQVFTSALPALRTHLDTSQRIADTSRQLLQEVVYNGKFIRAFLRHEARSNVVRFDPDADLSPTRDFQETIPGSLQGLGDGLPDSEVAGGVEDGEGERALVEDQVGADPSAAAAGAIAASASTPNAHDEGLDADEGS